MEECHEPLKKGRSEVITPGSEIAVLGVGSMVSVCQKVCEEIRDHKIAGATFVNVRFVKPLDTELLDRLFAEPQSFGHCGGECKAVGSENMYLLIWKPVIRK